ncbi:MAG TPA: SDR family oxidoreductase [Solirubrobacterales bacterium]|jgi:NAD(P)-dependent dehydrogenase (short-subunit alcohol dehydrogenase family)|nr:SDR family oxidoreductase [Solirubrobacterales bacterium]
MPDADWLGLGGRRVLVAGGAGTIGLALVAGFLEAGAAVAVIDVDLDGLGELRERVVAEQADLRDPDACRAAVAAARERLGGLDVFVHCVGINNRKPVEDYTDQEWEDILEINLSSAFHTATAVAPAMREQGDGRIVFFSSVAGRSGHKQHGPYAATKGALNQLARVMAHEYAGDGVTVNAVAPGYMETALTNAYLEANPAKKEALLGLIPAGRFGRLGEVVGPVLFLSSRQASFINGQVLYIDGGRSVV